MNVQITSIGHYLPDQVITNEMLSEKFIGFDTASIFKRTGIKERRFADRTGETTTTMSSLRMKLGQEKTAPPGPITLKLK